MDGESNSQYAFLEVLGRGTYGTVIKCAIIPATKGTTTAATAAAVTAATPSAHVDHGNGSNHGISSSPNGNPNDKSSRKHVYQPANGPATNAQPPPQYVAIKRFHGALRNTHAWQLASREARLLGAMQHPLVVALRDAFRSPSGRPYLVMEYVPRCVAAELAARPAGLPPRDVKLLTWQLALVLRHLHANRVLHRDIKPSNMLLTHSGLLKLCDFGFARFTGGSDPRVGELLTTYVVTRWYRAPELLLGLEYGPPADIWALGCTVAELAAGSPLLPGTSTADQLALIMQMFGQPPDQGSHGSPLRRHLSGLGSSLLELLEACLRTDPRGRPTAAQLLNMPYFFEISSLVVGNPELEELYRNEMGAGVAAAAAVATTAVALSPTMEATSPPPPPLHVLEPAGGAEPPLPPQVPLPELLTPAASEAAATAAAPLDPPDQKDASAPASQATYRPDPLPQLAITPPEAAPSCSKPARRPFRRQRAASAAEAGPVRQSTSELFGAPPPAAAARALASVSASVGAGEGQYRNPEPNRPPVRNRTAQRGYLEPDPRSSNSSGNSNLDNGLWVPWGSDWQARLASVRRGCGRGGHGEGGGGDGGGGVGGGGGEGGGGVQMAPLTPRLTQQAPEPGAVRVSSDVTSRAARGRRRLSSIFRSSAGGSAAAAAVGLTGADWRRSWGRRTNSSPPPLAAGSTATASAATSAAAATAAAANGPTHGTPRSLLPIDAVACIRTSRRPATAAAAPSSGGRWGGKDRRLKPPASNAPSQEHQLAQQSYQPQTQTDARQATQAAQCQSRTNGTNKCSSSRHVAFKAFRWLRTHHQVAAEVIINSDADAGESGQVRPAPTSGQLAQPPPPSQGVRCGLRSAAVQRRHYFRTSGGGDSSEGGGGRGGGGGGRGTQADGEQTAQGQLDTTAAARHGAAPAGDNSAAPSSSFSLLRGGSNNSRKAQQNQRNPHQQQRQHLCISFGNCSGAFLLSCFTPAAGSCCRNDADTDAATAAAYSTAAAASRCSSSSRQQQRFPCAPTPQAEPAQPLPPPRTAAGTRPPSVLTQEDDGDSDVPARPLGL